MLTIVVKGGLVRSVMSDVSWEHGRLVYLVDLDTDGADLDELDDITLDGIALKADVRIREVEPLSAQVPL